MLYVRKYKHSILNAGHNARKTILATAFVVAMPLATRAQYDPYFSHYFDTQTAFNPAAAGKQPKLNISATYAMTLAGFENAPKTIFLSGDMPFVAMRNEHGVGLQIMSDQLGLFNHQRLSAQYAFRKHIGKSVLAIGVQAGVIMESYDYSELDLDDTGDDAFSTSDQTGNGFDVGVGLYFSRQSWYVGVSAQHLTSPTIYLGETNELSIEPMFYLNAGLDIQLRNPLWKVATSGILRTDGVAYRGDVTGRLVYTYSGRQFYGGVTYSPTNSVTFLAGGMFKGITVGYSFEMYTNGISVRNGSHELFVGYQMDVDLGKHGRNRHQTTRTL